MGTRMRSAMPKVLHELAGRSLLGHALAAAEALAPDTVCVVYGHGGNELRAAFSNRYRNSAPDTPSCRRGMRSAAAVPR
jgi:bifunctional UDP-N-acetylglucosamine pyrophosphorylase/glucosamine-1-phosphate N-acetyltransferase